MGITCKPIGKQKSNLKKLQNRMEKEAILKKLAVEARKAEKEEKNKKKVLTNE